MRREERGGLYRDTRGAVYVEFLLAFLPFFFMFLGMLQIALMYTANLVVHHSATTAARAAVVVLPDNPSRYGGEPVNSVDGSGGGGVDSITSFLEWGGLGGGAPPIRIGGGGGSARLRAIRSAASLPLLAVSPSFDQLVGDPAVMRAVGGSPSSRAAVGASLYNRTAVAVTFPTAPGANSYKTRFGPDEQVTVRVTYLFHCAVPLVARVLCDDFMSLRSGTPTAALEDLRAATSRGASRDEIASIMRRVRHDYERLGRARAGMNELDEAETPWLGFVMTTRGNRFVVLRSEATLRNHGASYTYRGS